MAVRWGWAVSYERGTPVGNSSASVRNEATVPMPREESYFSGIYAGIRLWLRAAGLNVEDINVQRFRGGLVFKAHRLCVSLNSRLESNKEEEEKIPISVLS